MTKWRRDPLTYTLMSRALVRSLSLLGLIFPAGCRDAAVNYWSGATEQDPAAKVGDHEETAADNTPPAEGGRRSEADTVTGPRLSVDHRELPLGPITMLPAEQTATFELTNIGSEPLEIHSIETSCGCLAAVLETRVVAPEEKTSLLVTVNVDGYGEKTAQVVLHTNDSSYPRSRLTVSWIGVARFEAIPPRVDFGGMRPGAHVTQLIEVRRLDDSLDWNDVEMSVPDNLSVSEVPPAEGMIAAYEVSVVAEAVEGRQSGWLRFAEDREKGHPLHVFINWEVVDIVTVIPLRVFLGSGIPGEELKHPLIIRSNVEQPVEVSAVELTGIPEGLMVDLPTESGSPLILNLTYVLPETTGPLAGNLEIVLSQPEPRTLTIPISAIVTAVDTIAVEEAHNAVDQ